MGVTFFLGTALVLIVLLLIYGIYWCIKHCQTSFPRCFEKITKLKTKVFWNSVIRYTYLNALRLDSAALLAISYGMKTSNLSEVLGGVVLFVLFSGVIPAIYVWYLIRNLDELR